MCSMFHIPYGANENGPLLEDGAYSDFQVLEAAQAGSRLYRFFWVQIPADSMQIGMSDLLPRQRHC